MYYIIRVTATTTAIITASAILKTATAAANNSLKTCPKILLTRA